MRKFRVSVEKKEKFIVIVEYNKATIEVELEDLEDFSPFLEYFDKGRVEIIKSHANKLYQEKRGRGTPP